MPLFASTPPLLDDSLQLDSRSSPDMPDTQLRILTLNCWGLKFISKYRQERYNGITEEILKGNYDIVTLQEIWVFSEYQQVRTKLASRLPHAKFFYSGALGSGLAILSRYPFVASSIHPYSLNGAPIDVAAGDWFVGKAAASVVILHPILGQVEIFNTHLFAKGGEGGPEHNRAHRLVNAWEFAKLARKSAEGGRYVIAAGDFNSIPTTLPMTVIRDHAGLLDSWVVSNPRSLTATTALTAAEAIGRLGVTADSPLNSWSAHKPLDEFARASWGKRLDYILYRQPRWVRPDQNESYPVLHCTDCKVVLTNKIPGHEFSYSDHFGLEATFEVQYTSGSNLSISQSELSSESIQTVIQALMACYRFSRERARKELAIFGLCLLFLIFLAIGSAWLPFSWINPIFIVVSVAVAWLATTMLYEGFLFGNWECNALMNIAEEMELYRTVRITRGGSIRSWVAFALKFFEGNETTPLIIHTLPPSYSHLAATLPIHPTETSNQATNSTHDDATASTAEAKQSDASKTTSTTSTSSITANIPRMLTVVEIIKREYLKELAAKKSDRLLGLYQYNEVGCLEELEESPIGGETDQNQAEADRSERIVAMLQGKNFPKLKQTPYMRVILCGSAIPQLSGRRVTYQPPARRKISKSARARARKRDVKHSPSMSVS
ncbi:hypothetical protein AX16_000440 [Volvariella volvacea WC 439]|nr:hypothetical protein AX16_000440 [Volvariella volvacea WC 439]